MEVNIVVPKMFGYKYYNIGLKLQKLWGTSTALILLTQSR